jgi:hypothetical protein
MRQIRHWIVPCLLLIAGFLTPSPACAEREVVEKAPLGDWVILGIVDDARGEGACIVNRQNADGVVLAFVAERGSRSFSLAVKSQRQGWRLNPGTEHDIIYSVDGADISATARAFGENHLSILLGPEIARSDPLRLGRWIELQTEVGKFRFSLAGSSRALDALAKCAVEHLDFPDSKTAARSDVLENRHVGDWSLVAVAGDVGNGEICTVARYGEQRINLNIMVSRANRVLTFALDGTDAGWQLNEGAVYDVSFAVDDHPSLAAKARADSSSSILIPFATDFSQAEFLRAGDSLEFLAAKGTFRFSLDGSAAALDALQECARQHLGFGDAAPLADPQRLVEGANAPDEPPPDPRLEASIAAVKQLRIVRVIFEHDPSAERDFRARLGRVVSASSGDKKAVQREARAFLAERVRKAFQAAPADAFARLVEAELEVMRQLGAQPGYCAAYFDASRPGDLLPAELRAAQSDRVADVVEAGFTQPTPPSTLGESQFVSWIVGAYAALGYPAGDLAKLDNLGVLDDREICRLGTQLMTAVASLSTERAGEVYRWMKLSDLQ